jgi:hypothetical protein
MGDNIKIDPKEELLEWIQMAQDRDQWRAPVTTVINLRFSYKFGEFLDQLSDRQVVKDSAPWSLLTIL